MPRKHPKKGGPPVEQRIADAVNKAVKREVARVLARGGFSSEVEEVIPSGVDVVDRWLLGCGGWAVKRSSEVFGTEGAGKTAALFKSLAGCQKIGGLAVLAVTEEAESMERAKLYGLDPDKLLLLEPEYIGETLEQIEATLHAIPTSARYPTLIGWDSVAATPCLEEIREGVTGKVAMGLRASQLSHAIRVLAKLVSKKRAHLMFVNQIREEIGGYGYGFTTPGGHAIKFYASQRLQFVYGAQVKRGNQVVGREVAATNIKNKCGIPHRKAKLRLMFDSGWDNGWATANFAKDQGLIGEGSDSESPKVQAAAYEALGWAPAAPAEDKDAPKEVADAGTKAAP